MSRTLDIIQLAERRTDQHREKLDILQSAAKEIWHNVLDNDDAILTDGFVKMDYYASTMQTTEKISETIVETRHHMRWLVGLLRETPPGEMRDRLMQLINDVAPKTEATLNTIDTLIKHFNRLSKYNKN